MTSREKKREYDKTHWAKYKKRITEKRKTHFLNNKERILKERKEYYIKNKERINATRTKNYRKIREKENEERHIREALFCKKKYPKNYFKVQKFDMTQRETLRILRDYDKRQSGNQNYHPWLDGPIIGGCAL